MKKNVSFFVFCINIISALSISCGSGNKITRPQTSSTSEPQDHASTLQGISSDNERPSNNQDAHNLNFLPLELSEYSLDSLLTDPLAARPSPHHSSVITHIERTSPCAQSSHNQLRTLLAGARSVTNFQDVIHQAIPSVHHEFQLEKFGILYSNTQGASLEFDGPIDPTNGSRFQLSARCTGPSSFNFIIAPTIELPITLSPSSTNNEIFLTSSQAHIRIRHQNHGSTVISSALGLVESTTSRTLNRFLRHTSSEDHQVFLLADGRLMIVDSNHDGHSVLRTWTTYRLEETRF